MFIYCCRFYFAASLSLPQLCRNERFAHKEWLYRRDRHGFISKVNKKPIIYHKAVCKWCVHTRAKDSDTQMDTTTCEGPRNSLSTNYIRGVSRLTGHTNIAGCRAVFALKNSLQRIRTQASHHYATKSSQYAKLPRGGARKWIHELAQAMEIYFLVQKLRHSPGCFDCRIGKWRMPPLRMNHCCLNWSSPSTGSQLLDFGAGNLAFRVAPFTTTFRNERRRRYIEVDYGSNKELRLSALWERLNKLFGKTTPWNRAGTRHRKQK